jgi:hypothetical protein
MPHFPTLKTGAIVQYPAARSRSFATQIVRFIDGSEQRYREFATPLRRWTVALDLLDEGELALLEEFFLLNEGQFGSFAFTDPWDGREYPDCSFEQGTYDLVLEAEMRGRTKLTIQENRS